MKLCPSGTSAHIAGMSPHPEPSPQYWTDPAVYGDTFLREFVEPLERAVAEGSGTTRPLQQSLLGRLHWYFSVDMRERAPTVVVSEVMAERFHGLVSRLMRHIDLDSIESLDAPFVSAEVKHALLSYKVETRHSMPVLDAYDRDQKLARITYFIHGTRPSEAFSLDGRPVNLAWRKYRACRWFRRTLLHQRIVWLPTAGGAKLEVTLNGRTPLTFDMAIASVPLSQTEVAQQPVRGLDRLKRWLIRNLARLARPWFANAWVFTDRDVDADDNAEHLYRWVRHHHPEINGWFLLARDSCDWERLGREGFRLVPPGLKRKLLLLNCEHIVSSHVDQLYGGFSRQLYGDLMSWRYSFLQHGVSKDDLSHWLSGKPFHLFVTSSPPEQASIVADGTPYTYTEREARCTGMPRHDSLRALVSQFATEQVDSILVMPTWRARLAETGSLEAFRESEYVVRWRTLLRDDRLRELGARNRKQIVFMPHSEAMPYLAAFDVPSHVQVATRSDTRIQQLFCRSAVMITDYSSVAFEMAFLRRTVLFYQFDRERFYGGEHNWREGYFEWDRDGFGPVVTGHDELISALERVLANGPQPLPQYAERMERALPHRDGEACERVFNAILDLKRVNRNRLNSSV